MSLSVELRVTWVSGPSISLTLRPRLPDEPVAGPGGGVLIGIEGGGCCCWIGGYGRLDDVEPCGDEECRCSNEYWECDDERLSYGAWDVWLVNAAPETAVETGGRVVDSEKLYSLESREATEDLCPENCETSELEAETGSRE